MEPINKINSRTVVIPLDDVDTDQIIPARYLRTTVRAGLGENLFADWRYDKNGTKVADFVLNNDEANGAEILVTGRNFGCGSSREHAPWALLDYGFRAVISTEIADIFRSNSLKNGFLPVVVDEQTHEGLIKNPGAEITLDIESSTLVLPDGRSTSFPLESFSQYCLLNGIDELGFLMDNSASIDAYEEQTN